MSQTITHSDNTKITLTKTGDYRDSYANSVQVRLSIWDFFLVFGTVDTDAQPAPDQIQITNFQGIYLSPQQAKALQNVLNNNLAQYEKTFGPISLDATNPAAQRFVIPSGPVH